MTNQTNVVRFSTGVEMSVEELEKLSGVKTKLASAEREETEKRLAPALSGLSTLVNKLLASGKLTTDDLPRLFQRCTIADDGKAYVDVKTRARRSGEPSDRDAITQQILRQHNVSKFIRPKRGNVKSVEASDVGGMLDVAGVPHYFSAMSHESAQCGATGGYSESQAAKCGRKSHGDEAGRAVLQNLDKLADDGWRMVVGGKQKSVRELRDIATKQNAS